MTNDNIRNTLLFFCVLFFLVGCSTTKNLPEEEVLYTGIKDITYGYEEWQKKTARQEEAGVITSFADAYKAVDEILATRNLSALRQAEKPLTKAQRDSLKTVENMVKSAYNEAKVEVEAALAYAPNNAFFGSSSLRIPFPLGLWIYNGTVGKESRFSRWMLNNFGANPVYVSTVNPTVRALVAQNTLRNYGYLNGSVSYEVLPEKNPRKAKVSYTVLPHRLYRLDSIAYLHFPLANDTLIQKSLRATHLKKGDPFSVVNLDAERTRLYHLFRNNGYYYYKPEYITYRADTLQRKGFVQLQVVPHQQIPQEARKKYYLGTTQLSIYNHDYTSLTDTLSHGDYTYLYDGRDAKKPPLRMMAVRRNLYYQRSMPYRQDWMNLVQERLSGMDVFSSVTIQYVPRDTTLLNDTLDVQIVGVLDKPYDGEFTTKVTSKSNGQIGPGVSFSMSKRNAFRGAEKVRFEVHGSYEWQTNNTIGGRSTVVNSYEYGTSLSLDYPRLVMPYGRRLSRRSATATSFVLDATWFNRANYFGMVSLGARASYTYQSRPTLKHEFTPFRLDYDELLNTTMTFDSIMNANQALYVSLRDQFVPSMQYTFTYSSRRRARNPRTFILDVKEGGNVTSGIFAAFGEPFRKQNKKLFNVPFAQFVKVSAEFREQFRLTPRTSLATRIGVGALFSYGNSSAAPYNELFSVGGANSIRAFTVRGVGPGRYRPGATRYSYIDQMGDLKLEMNVEYRFPIVSSLYGAVFLDAGNVWLMDADDDRPGGTLDASRFGRDLALGTGLGVRYDLDFLVLRFDVGVGLHAPYDTGKKGYYNMTRFKDSLGYHLAIGYPF